MPSLASFKQDNNQRPCTRLSLSRITRRRRRRPPRHRRRTNRSLPKSDWSRRSSSFDRKELTEKNKNKKRKTETENKIQYEKQIPHVRIDWLSYCHRHRPRYAARDTP